MKTICNATQMQKSPELKKYLPFSIHDTRGIVDMKIFRYFRISGILDSLLLFCGSYKKICNSCTIHMKQQNVSFLINMQSSCNISCL